MKFEIDEDTGDLRAHVYVVTSEVEPMCAVFEEGERAKDYSEIAGPCKTHHFVIKVHSLDFPNMPDELKQKLEEYFLAQRI